MPTRSWLLRLVLLAPLLLGGSCLGVPTAGVAATGPPTFTHGTLTHLTAPNGTVLAHTDTPTTGAGLRRVGADHWATSDTGEVDGLPGARVTVAVTADGDEWVVQPTAGSPEPGVWGVTWAVEGIPLDSAILVPGRSGVRLTAEATHGREVFDWPLAWEAAFVVVESADGHGGFYVRADDPDDRFKQLVVERRADDWRLELTAVNQAPFDDDRGIESFPWRVGVYEGDWRQPARRYRDWLAEHFQPTPVAQQQPGWVGDLRGVFIMDFELEALEALARRLDPRQTLLYLYGWRANGYDRDYPDYDQPRPEFAPFVARAKALGYRVMLHVNYFGVDPLNPLYEQFEDIQVRDPFSGERLWWLWTDADPDIKFAYINPAYRPWRELFVERMVRLCRTYDIDALHLDQTPCIFNDQNGLIDGLSMAEGNEALHRELRAALPEVALSGEGLNEVTCRHEAFAQRHPYGLDFIAGTWNRRQLAQAHPIASYVLLPYTQPYGYLGYAAPTDEQLYAAWQENYRRWGVLPTLKDPTGALQSSSGFVVQLLDELAAWQQHRLAPDLERAWPDDVAFPLRAADGTPAAYTTDRRLVIGDETITRTVTGVTEVAGPGSIPGWPAYDAERVFALEPTAWYPWLEAPRDLDAFHLTKLPDGVRPAGVALLDTAQGPLGMIATTTAEPPVALLTELLGQATTGARPAGGDAVEVTGALHAANGATFLPGPGGFMLHPPWIGGPSGTTYARWRIELPEVAPPSGLRFVSAVTLGQGAVGTEADPHSDGVVFTVTAQPVDGQPAVSAEVHQTTELPQALDLDLTPLAGRAIDLTLTLHPGEANDPSFDWARWHEPRVLVERVVEGEVAVAGPQRWRLALQGERAVPLTPTDPPRVVPIVSPGTTYLLSQPPAPVTVPVDLADLARYKPTVIVLNDQGSVLEGSPYAGAQPSTGTVGGVTRAGLQAHPPNRGRTVLTYALTLPDEPLVVESWVGLRDGSESTGVIFGIAVNGTTVAEAHSVPGAWQPLRAVLSPWAGRPVVLSLITDSDGPFNFDWAVWGEPVLRGVPRR